MAERPPAPDQAARTRASTDLAPTLFVEAGAGSGKTTALVDRVLALVTGVGGQPPVPLAAVAAITFTEKAGAELRERLRQRLEQAAADPAGGPDADRCRRALADLDGAAIGTLHSFAQRILSEHPVEAGLPPRVDVLDEVTSGVQFERRWARFSDSLLADPAYARTLLLLSAAGVRDTTAHALARTFDANWDLVATHVDPDAPPPAPTEGRVDVLLDRIGDVCRLLDDCRDPTDRLAERLVQVREWVEGIREAADEPARVESLRARAVSLRPGNVGRRDSWKVPVADVRAALRDLEAEIDAVLLSIAEECAHHLGAAIRRFTLASAAERQAAGALEFHDMLVLARALLRHPDHGPDVRAALHLRYQRLLLDEFQDTDPIQIELAVRIAAADPRSDAAGTADWQDVEVGPGRLFVVGDPKQSIYRFRRADVRVFLAVQEMLGADGGHVSLTTNFRTVPGVVDWVNATFAPLMAEPPDQELPLAPRPDYTPLVPVRTDPPPDGGPPVAVLGRAPHETGTTAAQVRAAEAAEVAATIRRAIGERWRVGDDDDGWREARLGDITVLVPARTSLPYLEDALDAAGIAYRAEASSLVYASRPVRDLLMVVRAVADPTDELRIVSALRTPLFGCGDDDLYRFRVERGGHWRYTAGQPPTVPDDDPVAAGLEAMKRWHDERAWTSPSALLEAIVAERRAFELAFAEGRPRDVWRRLRFVVDQARAWTDATGGDVRGYLDWVAHQTVEGARVAEAVLPETDDDAVRIMTIHAAKGLEFPITVVSGLSSNPSRGPAAGDARFTAEGVAYYLGKHAETTEFTASRPLDEQMDLDERVRLLYVATTRARDHLVVSLHRTTRRSTPSTPAHRTNAELLVEGMGALLDSLPDAATAAAPAAPPPAPPVLPSPPEPFGVWEVAHATALAAASRPSTVAATALTDDGRPDVEVPEDEPVALPVEPGDDGPRRGDQLTLDLDAPAPGSDPDLDLAPDGGDGGLGKRPRDLDLPPWLKGRYGTAVGRAVHGVLQTVPLDAAPESPVVAAAVAAQCQAEAVPDRADTVADLVARALTAPVVAEAAAAPHWREVYASAPVGDGTEERLLEGYVDLLFRRPDGLVVVDYKTASSADPALLARRVDGYRAQGAAYALAVGRATGEAVVQVTFLFLTPEGAFERHLSDLPAAVAAVEADVRAGTALVLP